MYGVLKSNINTGSDTELEYGFAAPLAVTSNQPAFVSDTLSLKRRTGDQKVQRFEIEAQVLQSNDASASLAHSVMNGYTNIIYVRMPQPYRGKDISLPNNLSLQVSQSKLAGTDNIDVLGLNGRSIPRGDFISFANDSKVYCVVASNGSNITVHPPFRKNKIANEGITYGDRVTMRARYDDTNILGFKYVDGIVSDPGIFRFIEAL